MARLRFGNFSLRVLVSALTANRLIRYPDKDGTIALTSDLYLYPNAVRQPTLPASGAETQILIDGSGIVYEFGFGDWRAKDDTKLTPSQRSGASRGLIYNGGCTLPAFFNPSTPSVRRVPGCSGIYRYAKGGSGWRDVRADIFDKICGDYSLSYSGRAIIAYDDPFPVLPGVIYGCWGQIKQSSPGANYWYQMLLALDDDGNTITPTTYQYVRSSRSRLATALVSGATQVEIQRFRDAPGTSDPVTSWTPAIGYPNLGTFGIFNWVSGDGFVFPTWENETAQRSAYTRRLLDWVNPVTISGNNFVITLYTAYSGPTIPAGTPVANMLDGSTFIYPNSGNYSSDTSWLSISPGFRNDDDSARLAGQSGLFAVAGSYAGNPSVMPLPPWTAQILPGMLVGYGANDSAITNWHYDIYPIPIDQRPSNDLILGGNSEATSTTTGALRIPGIGLGNGRGVFAKGVAFSDSVSTSQINRSLYFNNGNPSFKLGNGVDVAATPLSLPAPTPVTNVLGIGVMTIPFNAGQTSLAQYIISTPIAFTPATTRVVGGVTSIVVVADGVNIPTLSGITMLAGSLSHDNRSGAKNTYQFTDDGQTVLCQILRAAIPALTGLTTIGLNFSVTNSNFTIPSAGSHSSSNATAFSGSGGSAVSVPAGKDFQLQARVDATSIVGVHNNNTTATAGTTQSWLYYVWNAAGTLFTAEGSTTQASSVTGISGKRFVQIKRVGSVITISQKVNAGDAWSTVRVMPTASTTALFVMLGTTSGSTIDNLLLEVQQ